MGAPLANMFAVGPSREDPGGHGAALFTSWFSTLGSLSLEQSKYCCAGHGPLGTSVHSLSYRNRILTQ